VLATMLCFVSWRAIIFAPLEATCCHGMTAGTGPSAQGSK
jgi:hypothetical protein